MRQPSIKTAWIPELDGLRGIAILLVLFFHFTFFPLVFVQGVSIPDQGFYSFIHRLLQAGWAGVDLFFVLSGFLITRILLATKHEERFFRGFYWRRALRIFPAYYALLLVWILLPGNFFGMVARAGDADYFYWLIAYMGNFLMAGGGNQMLPMPLQHLWSLAVEEQFYLIWPLFVYFFDRKRLLFATALLFFAALLSRCYFLPNQFWSAYVLPSSRMDALALGAALAVLEPYFFVKAWLAKIKIATGFSFALLAFFFIFRGGLKFADPFITAYGLTALAVFFSCVVAWSAMEPNRFSFLRQPILRWFGRYSYGLYLYHQPVCILFLYKFSPFITANLPLAVAWPIFVFIPFAISVLLSFISWHLVEKYFMRLRNLAPSQSGKAKL